MVNTESGQWVIIGRFGRVHGIKGTISVLSFTEPSENILHYLGSWHAYIHKKWHPVDVFNPIETHRSLLVQVRDYASREEVALLTNCDIAIRAELLPSLDEGQFYWHQLTGMQVQTQQGILLGTVKEIIPTGANDVLVVVGEKRHLIPYLPNRYVLKVDMQQQCIIVDWDLEF